MIRVLWQLQDWLVWIVSHLQGVINGMILIQFIYRPRLIETGNLLDVETETSRDWAKVFNETLAGLWNACTHTHMHTNTHPHIHTRMHTCTHTRTHTRAGWKRKFFEMHFKTRWFGCNSQNIARRCILYWILPLWGVSIPYFMFFLLFIAFLPKFCGFWLY